MSKDNPWWHIVWVTWQAWPPTDARGDWRGLAELYNGFAESRVMIEMSDPLPGRWQCRPLRDEAVRLPSAALNFLVRDLHELASSDRIAGGMEIQALAVAPTSVQLLLSCPRASLKPRVGRLKSRSATLMSFRKELGIGGARTWGKGIWWARIQNGAVFNAVERSIAKAVEAPAG